MSASAEELSQIAGELQSDVERFRTGDDSMHDETPAISRAVDLRARSAAYP
jgi:hypothetical protein